MSERFGGFCLKVLQAFGRFWKKCKFTTDIQSQLLSDLPLMAYDVPLYGMILFLTKTDLLGFA